MIPIFKEDLSGAPQDCTTVSKTIAYERRYSITTMDNIRGLLKIH